MCSNFISKLQIRMLVVDENKLAMHAQYSRYEDDIFCIFYSLEYVKMFFIFLKDLHHILKFTYEIAPHKLAFMDTLMSLSSNNDFSLITNVYRKPTDTKIILNFHAVCPWIWKCDLIKSLLNSAFIDCNIWCVFHEEISIL